MPDATSNQVPRLQLEHISKTFGRYRALSDVSFEVAKGELHGLVGQNGSGKSTLAKVLTGYHAPDPGGVVTVDGEQLALPAQHADLERHHVAVVHQSLGLLDEMTVLENLRLGQYGHRRFSRRIDWQVEAAAVVGVLERLECDVNLKALVGTLSAETKATLAIARAIQGQQPGSGLIIFDESTRALNRDALTRFYTLVRGVIDSDASVLLICHRMEEVLEHTDRVTVLRDGKLAAAGLKTSALTEAELTRTMLGYSLTRHSARATRRPTADVAAAPAGAAANENVPAASVAGATAAVQVTGLSGRVIRDFDLNVAPGEIVGVTGLVGSGFSELPYLLSGAVAAVAGTLRVPAAEIDLVRAKGDAQRFLEAKISLIPQDRDRAGLMLDEPISVNISLPRVAAHSRVLRVDKRWERAEVAAVIKRLGISPPEPELMVSALSGGNQQKVLLGKWLAGEPDLLLLHEPTQAVDVGARRDILEAIEETAARGTSIAIASTYADELAMICDRVLVFHEGVVVAELTGELDEDQIIEATFRTHKERVAGAA